MLKAGDMRKHYMEKCQTAIVTTRAMFGGVETVTYDIYWLGGYISGGHTVKRADFEILYPQD